MGKTKVSELTDEACAALGKGYRNGKSHMMKRYREEGIKGLETRAGRGRPPILSHQNPEYLEKVKAEIKKHPTSVKTVVSVLEEDLDLVLHPETLKRFLKKMVTDSLDRRFFEVCGKTDRVSFG